MTLDGLGACGLVSLVELLQELWFDNVARVENYCNIIEFELRQVVDGQLL